MKQTAAPVPEAGCRSNPIPLPLLKRYAVVGFGGGDGRQRFDI